MGDRKLKPCATKGKEKQNVETMKAKGLKRFWVWALWDIKFLRSGLYGEDRDENYFIIICI